MHLVPSVLMLGALLGAGDLRGLRLRAPTGWRRAGAIARDLLRGGWPPRHGGSCGRRVRDAGGPRGAAAPGCGSYRGKRQARNPTGAVLPAALPGAVGRAPFRRRRRDGIRVVRDDGLRARRVDSSRGELGPTEIVAIRGVALAGEPRGLDRADLRCPLAGARARTALGARGRRSPLRSAWRCFCIRCGTLADWGVVHAGVAVVSIVLLATQLRSARRGSRPAAEFTAPSTTRKDPKESPRGRRRSGFRQRRSRVCSAFTQAPGRMVPAGRPWRR